jgi:hypothetical protein
MNLSAVTPLSTSLNAKVGAVALALAAFFTLLLSHVWQPLAPLRLLALSFAAFAAWAFCDEMGLRKPLNRAGFVFFAIAVAAKVQVTLGVSTVFIGRYYLLYATFLLTALLFWSVAFLHRQRTLKVVGAVGVLASLAPIVALVVGHVVVGVGAVLGVESILSAANSTSSTTPGLVTLVERIFGIWGYAAAWLLWRGHIQATAHPLQ